MYCQQEHCPLSLITMDDHSEESYKQKLQELQDKVKKKEDEIDRLKKARTRSTKKGPIPKKKQDIPQENRLTDNLENRLNDYVNNVLYPMLRICWAADVKSKAIKYMVMNELNIDQQEFDTAWSHSKQQN